jgi:hypothetical protein
MAIVLQITHTVKPIPNPYNRIETLRGFWCNSNAPFSYTEDEIIRMIEAAKTRPDGLKFIVKVKGVDVPVTVALRNGSRFLKTAADSSYCNILLNLPSS